MHRKLLLEAFKKVENDEELTKKTHVTVFLSDYILEDSGEPYGEKILRIHYNNAISNTDDKVELKSFAANSLSRYLGYSSFSTYDKKAPENISKGDANFFIKHKIKITAILAIVVGLLLVTFFSIENQKWMVWEKDHYKKVPFDVEKYNMRELKIYNENRIVNFKKIIPDCNTVYFNNNGNENIWYGKNKVKKLEFFTSLGLHPETSKTLKPITPYMIVNHICESYKK